DLPGGAPRRRPAGGGGGAGLQGVPAGQQVRPAGPQLAGQLRRGGPLGEAAKDQEDPRRGAMGPLPGGGGVQVEDPPAVAAAVVDDRGGGAVAMDGVAVAPAAAGAGQSVGMEQVQQPLIAGGLVHQVEDREVHGVASGGDPIQETAPRGGWEGPTTNPGT